MHTPAIQTGTEFLIDKRPSNNPLMIAVTI